MTRRVLNNLMRHCTPNAGTIIVVALMLVAYSAWAAPAAAPTGPGAVPGVISYQGNLTDAAGEPVHDDVDMTFRFYDGPDGGTALWREAHTGDNAVPVRSGLFNVLLGSLEPIPATVCNSSAVYLGLTVGSDPEMTPRGAVGMVPYALVAQRAFGLSAADGNPADAVTVNDDGQVTSPAIEIQWQNEDARLRFVDPGNDWYSMGIDHDDGFKFKINNGPLVGGYTHLTMLPTGQVGIGTANPEGLLDVSGDLVVQQDIYWKGQLRGMTVTEELEVYSTWVPPYRALVADQNSICFLTYVDAREADEGDEYAICMVYPSEGKWWLGTDVRVDTWVHCKARCLQW